MAKTITSERALEIYQGAIRRIGNKKVEPEYVETARKVAEKCGFPIDELNFWYRVGPNYIPPKSGGTRLHPINPERYGVDLSDLRPRTGSSYPFGNNQGLIWAEYVPSETRQKYFVILLIPPSPVVGRLTEDGLLIERLSIPDTERERVLSSLELNLRLTEDIRFL